MEIHRPKAPHSFREFLSEIGVVVIGIAIALSGEQALEALHWRHEVDQARAALRTEVAHNLDTLDFIITEEPCIDRRLVEVGGELGVAGAPRLKHPMAQPQFPNFLTEAWDSARASGVTSHMPDDEARIYRSIYTNVDWTRARVDEERTDWARLSALDLGAPISPTLQADLLPVLAHARAIAEKFSQNNPLALSGDSANATLIGTYAAQVGVSQARTDKLGLRAATLTSRRAFCEGA